jgi:hypothetical protein
VGGESAALSKSCSPERRRRYGPTSAWTPAFGSAGVRGISRPHGPAACLSGPEAEARAYAAIAWQTAARDCSTGSIEVPLMAVISPVFAHDPSGYLRGDHARGPCCRY